MKQGRITYSGNGVWLAETARTVTVLPICGGGTETHWMSEGTYYTIENAKRAIKRAGARLTPASAAIVASYNVAKAGQ